LASGDYIDLKAYEPAMRHMVDTYIRAEESEKISAFDDMSLIQLIVERGIDVAAEQLKGVMKNQENMAEAIENNVRKIIINESPVDPAYYEKMSKLLDALIEQRRKGVASYAEYLKKIASLAQQVVQPGGPAAYPSTLKTPAQRTLYNNLGMNADIALKVDAAVLASRQDDWRNNSTKTKKVRNAIWFALSTDMPADLGLKVASGDVPDVAKPSLDDETDRVLNIVKHQSGY
jgi:type I restriction enzyme R subunit